MHLLVNTYGSANAALEELGTDLKVFICSSRIESKRIKQALVSTNYCDVTTKTLWLSNSRSWYSRSLCWNSCSLLRISRSLRSHSCWKWYAWIWSLVCTSLIFQPVRGVESTTPCKSLCSHVLNTSTYPAPYLSSVTSHFKLTRPAHSWRIILAKSYFVLLIVIDNERASISLDGYDLNFPKLSYHSRRVVRTQPSDAGKD